MAEGGVGGGTGMSTFDFKGGIGTASRRVVMPMGEYTVGVLVQSILGGATNCWSPVCRWAKKLRIYGRYRHPAIP